MRFLLLRLALVVLLPLPLRLKLLLFLLLLRGSENFELPAVPDRDLPHWLVAPRGLCPTQPVDNIHALHNAPKHHVLPVQPRRGLDRDEELAVVGVGAAVGHREQPTRRVPDLHAFVGEVLAVDALSTLPVALGDVPRLQHEVGDHAVEVVALVVQLPTVLGLAPDAQLPEVFGGLGDMVREELEDDPAGVAAPVRDVEEDLWAARAAPPVRELLVLSRLLCVVRGDGLPGGRHPPARGSSLPPPPSGRPLATGGARAADRVQP
mmetsp:Transcript_45366/g.110469  ORF Transcript_45366/g.110469 Transcript_45366/m.110469 type:complete len:264 (+) Transcript_45366:143-934(+)